MVCKDRIRSTRKRKQSEMTWSCEHKFTTTRYEYDIK